MTGHGGDAAYAYVGAFVDELARAGVKHACIAPGSRSTPLALTIANHPSITTWMHVDERSAAFFALGMARTLDEPVVLLCTSGTAAANFFPAIVEAKIAGVPLVVLTADRPPELREVGAAQTIEQNRLYGSHVKWFVEVALPEATPDLLRYARTLAGRATALAAAMPPGPVHLNFPLREPLVPDAHRFGVRDSSERGMEAKGRAGDAPWVRVSDPRRSLDDQSIKRLAARLSGAARPLFICGPQSDTGLAPVAASLSKSIGAPLLADPLSQLRWGSHDRETLIDRYDPILRHQPFADGLAPDVVLRIGGAPTSKALIEYLMRNSDASMIVIDEGRWPDPTLLAEEMVHADPRLVCRQLLGEIDGNKRLHEGWLRKWTEADAVARGSLEQYTCSLSEPFEGRALADVVSALPDGSTLFVSSSMPVRDLDAFGTGDRRKIRVLANRGANGIDGVVSSALGAAAALRETSGGPLVLVIGDLAFYHDMNGLLAAKLHALDVTVVILNNDGGGIFSFLPQSEFRSHFEQLFGTPHGLEFAPVASVYGGHYRRAHDSDSLIAAVNEGVSGKGLHLVELRTDRERNVVLHREAWAAVGAALDSL